MKAFGGLKAINKVDFELPKNEIRGIIGPNGSGKSTFFNLVSGVYDPDPGSYIEFDGHDITEEPPHKVGELGLADYAEMNASELSGGQRRLLVLARAIAGKPKLLMLDEPAAGLSPVNVDNLMKILMRLKEKYGLTLIIIEHILKVVMDTCSKVTVLDHGEKIAEGTPTQIKDDNAVIEAYLGKKMDDEEMRKALAV